MFRKAPPSLIVSHRDPAVRERILRLAEGPLLASSVRGRVKVRVKRPKSRGAVASANPARQIIRVHPKALGVPDGALQALIAHEIGHIHHKHGPRHPVLLPFVLFVLTLLLTATGYWWASIGINLTAAAWVNLGASANADRDEVEAETFVAATVSPEAWQEYCEWFGTSKHTEAVRPSKLEAYASA